MIGDKRAKVQDRVRDIADAAGDVDDERLAAILRAARPNNLSKWAKTLWSQESARAVGRIPKGYPVRSMAPMVDGRVVVQHDDPGDGGMEDFQLDPALRDNPQPVIRKSGVIPSMRGWLRDRTDRAGLVKRS